MSTVTMHRCDQCGKLAERPLTEVTDVVPKGWRLLKLPFSVGPKEGFLEACSPGCAKRMLGENVDAEWAVGEAEYVVMSQESVDAIASATRSAA